MKRIVDLLIVLLFCAWPCEAQNRAWHWVTTHKTPLLLSAVVGLAESADAASSIHCQGVSKSCVEDGPVGKHPSKAATWGWASLVIGGTTASNLIWWHQTEKDAKDLRPLMFLWNAPLVIMDGITTSNNVNDAEYLQRQKQARVRLR